MIRFLTLFLFLCSSLYSKSVDLEKSKKTHIGIEMNPLTLLAPGGTTFFVSTTFSVFDPKNRVEIAMPVLWMKEDRSIDYYQNSHNVVFNYEESVITIDMHYRKYLRSLTDGVYFSGFARYCRIKGKRKNEDVIQTTGKFGIGTGVGFRYLPKKSANFYYGMSFNVGRYLTGENDVYDDPFFINDKLYFFDIEIFKFGYIF